jgi:hypothetical protein
MRIFSEALFTILALWSTSSMGDAPYIQLHEAVIWEAFSQGNPIRIAVSKVAKDAPVPPGLVNEDIYKLDWSFIGQKSPYQTELWIQRSDSIFVVGKIESGRRIFLAAPYLVITNTLKIGDSWKCSISIPGIIDTLRFIAERVDTLNINGKTPAIIMSRKDRNSETFRWYARGLGIVKDSIHILSPPPPDELPGYDP